MAKLENVITRDVTANRPAAGIAGQLFYDTTLNKWQRDNGAGWDDCAGAGGATIYTTAYSAPPGAPAAGDLWMPSDSFYVLRYTGAAWIPWGPNFPMTPPVSGDFAWVNQGGASVDTTYGGIYLLDVVGAPFNFRIRKKAAPATPYTVTAAILPQIYGVDYNTVGLVFRESGTGKLATLNYGHSTELALDVSKWSDPSTWSAAYTGVNLKTGYLLWLRIADNGVNRICSWSTDGQHWIVLHTVGRTDYLTADEVGFYAMSANATYPAAMTLLSWKEA